MGEGLLQGLKMRRMKERENGRGGMTLIQGAI